MNIDFLDAGCADAIHINFKGNDDKTHNIIIDGGSEKGRLYEAGHPIASDGHKHRVTRGIYVRHGR